MTKKEKKEIVQQLIQEVESTSSQEEYSEKRSQLFHEIINSGYPEENIEGVILSVNEWCNDFDMNMKAKISNQILPNDKQFMALSKLGLINMIDTSVLPD